MHRGKIVTGVTTGALALGLATMGVAPTASAAPARSGVDRLGCSTVGKLHGDGHVHATFTIRWHRERQNNRIIDSVRLSATERYVKPIKGATDPVWTQTKFWIGPVNNRNPRVNTKSNAWTISTKPVAGWRVDSTKATATWRVKSWSSGVYTTVSCTRYFKK